MSSTPAPPRWLKPVNRVLVALSRTGLAMRSLPVLTVPGRNSGRPRNTPLSVMELDGERYLMGGFPGADWVRNVRAADGATLRTGRRSEAIRLVELDAEAAVPVLREWPSRIPHGVPIMKDAGMVTDGTPDEFAQLAGTCAVFRVEPARGRSPRSGP
jgi:deazaflavin-dependent oxidoreductase (nitroreductase family)